MSATLEVFDLAEVREDIPYSTCLLVMDTRDQYLSLNLDSKICKLLQLPGNLQLELLKGVAGTLSPSLDFATSAEFFIRGGANYSLRKIVLALLPTAVSRHNSPGRPHALSALMRGLKYSDQLMIILNSSTRDIAFSQACAVGRQFPTFSMKSSCKTTSAQIIIGINCIESLNTAFLHNVRMTIEHIRLAQRLVDMPPNILHSDRYVDECRAAVSKIPQCSLQIIQGPQLEVLGLHGLWGVGQASVHLPALVVLSYRPDELGDAENKSICLVGKGITYDTGGLSIKTPTTSMAGMKTDMAGSAAVLGAFLSAVSQDLFLRESSSSSSPASAKDGLLTRPLHALLCIAENSVDERSTRPDDVQVFLSGKSVEVNNTDAEGRLVLADGCCWAARHLNPMVIMDAATLTGAQLIATGRNLAAIYCRSHLT